MSHSSRFRFRKRIKKRHQSSRRMEFYADRHKEEAKPFNCRDEDDKKADS